MSGIDFAGRGLGFHIVDWRSEPIEGRPSTIVPALDRIIALDWRTPSEI